MATAGCRDPACLLLAHAHVLFRQYLLQLLFVLKDDS